MPSKVLFAGATASALVPFGSPRPEMEVPSLRDLFWAHRGPFSDKWEQYLAIYESELGPHLERKAPVVLLEIGVENGGSLEIWHKLLPPHSRVVGIDINERCRELQLTEGIELHIGDATQKAFINRALGETCFDIIIDDGSHRSSDIIATFEILFGRLKPGGTYFVGISIVAIGRRTEVAFAPMDRRSSGLSVWSMPSTPITSKAPPSRRAKS